MKKTIVLGVAGLIMLGGATQASAYFEEGQLFQVAYQENNKELATDLGRIGVDFNLTDQNVALTAPGTISTAMGNVASWGDLRLAYFMENSDQGAFTFDLYIAGTEPTALTLVEGVQEGLTSWYSYSNNSEYIGNYYTTFGSQTVVADATNTKAYDMVHNSSSNAQGFYSGLNLTSAQGEAELSALDAGGYVDMYLYHFGTIDYTTYDAGLIPGDTADYSAVIRLNADGSTVLNPVPLPGSALLFGSSLLGLFGIRRKVS